MKRTLLSVALVCSMLFIYHGWVDVELPQSAEDLNNDLDRHALTYDVIDGTPLIVARFGDSVFLDTIQLQRVSKNFPPYPQWQWTGNWERVNDPSELATAELSGEFGPIMLFGVLNNESITTLEIVRDGEIVQRFSVDGRAYILLANDVRLTDTAVFLDEDGNVVVTKALM